MLVKILQVKIHLSTVLLPLGADMVETIQMPLEDLVVQVEVQDREQ